MSSTRVGGVIANLTHLGSAVALLVNNLGGTSNLELLVVVHEAIRYLGKGWRPNLLFC